MTIDQEAQPTPVAASSSVGPMPSVLPKKDPIHRRQAVRRAAPFAITAVVALFLGFGIGDVQGVHLQAENKTLSHEVATLKHQAAGQKIALSAARDVATTCQQDYATEHDIAGRLSQEMQHVADNWQAYGTDPYDPSLAGKFEASTSRIKQITADQQALTGCDGSGS